MSERERVLFKRGFILSQANSEPPLYLGPYCTRHQEIQRALKMLGQVNDPKIQLAFNSLVNNNDIITIKLINQPFRLFRLYCLCVSCLLMELSVSTLLVIASCSASNLFPWCFSFVGFRYAAFWRR